MEFLIAYDIGDAKRLRRVARLLEWRAVRCQYSVFVFRGGREEVERLLDQAAARMELNCDRIQAWPIGRDADAPAMSRGVIIPLDAVAAVLDGALRIVPHKRTRGG